MLVLSRKEGQRVVIGDNIVVTINKISGNRITLGIEAPKDVRVIRGELETVAPPTSSGQQGLSFVETHEVNTFDSINVELPGPLAHRMRNSVGSAG